MLADFFLVLLSFVYKKLNTVSWAISLNCLHNTAQSDISV